MRNAMIVADPGKHRDAGAAEKASQMGRASVPLSPLPPLNRRDFLLTAATGLAAASLGVARAENIQTVSAPGQQDRSSWATYWNESSISDSDVDNLKRSFVPGRDYFILRSGRARLIIQADQASTSPGFLWLGFDSRANKVTQFRNERRKEDAINFDAGKGFLRSALEVLLGGFPFTSIAHETKTRWVWIEAIPAVEAQWWAGGLLVTEHFFAADSGVFVRRITVASQNLGGTEEITLRLSHPEGESTERGDWLVQENAQSRMALSSDSSHPRKLSAASSQLAIGPLVLHPGEAVSADSWLSVDFPHEPWAPPENVGQSIRRISVAWKSASSVTTEDATVLDIFDKARAGLGGMVSDDGSMDNGIFEYGAQWVRDTSATMTGLLHAGHFDLARAALVHLLRDLIDSNGRTMVNSGFEDPDREELDQMGEVLDALRSYVDWTGDESLVREYRSRLVSMIERPLQPEFRHANGMVHNRREYWEREFGDGFELIYQVYVALGLRRAASLAEPLDAMDRAQVCDRKLTAHCRLRYTIQCCRSSRRTVSSNDGLYRERGSASSTFAVQIRTCRSRRRRFLSRSRILKPRWQLRSDLWPLIRSWPAILLMTLRGSGTHGGLAEDTSDTTPAPNPTNPVPGLFRRAFFFVRNMMHACSRAVAVLWSGSTRYRAAAAEHGLKRFRSSAPRLRQPAFFPGCQPRLRYLLFATCSACSLKTDNFCFGLPCIQAVHISKRICAFVITGSSWKFQGLDLSNTQLSMAAIGRWTRTAQYGLGETSKVDTFNFMFDRKSATVFLERSRSQKKIRVGKRRSKEAEDNGQFPIERYIESHDLCSTCFLLGRGGRSSHHFAADHSAVFFAVQTQNAQSKFDTMHIGAFDPDAWNGIVFDGTDYRERLTCAIRVEATGRAQREQLILPGLRGTREEDNTLRISHCFSKYDSGTAARTRSTDRRHVAGVPVGRPRQYLHPRERGKLSNSARSQELAARRRVRFRLASSFSFDRQQRRRIV